MQLWRTEIRKSCMLLAKNKLSAASRKKSGKIEGKIWIDHSLSSPKPRTFINCLATFIWLRWAGTLLMTQSVTFATPIVAMPLSPCIPRPESHFIERSPMISNMFSADTFQLIKDYFLACWRLYFHCIDSHERGWVFDVVLGSFHRCYNLRALSISLFFFGWRTSFGTPTDKSRTFSSLCNGRSSFKTCWVVPAWRKSDLIVQFLGPQTPHIRYKRATNGPGNEQGPETPAKRSRWRLPGRQQYWLMFWPSRV